LCRSATRLTIGMGVPWAFAGQFVFGFDWSVAA